MFINQEARFDRINEGLPYLIGPAPLVAYTVEDYRVEVDSAQAGQLSVRRRAPGLFGADYCVELAVTQQKLSVAANDNDNLERWIDPEDLRLARWGTPYAQPLTVSWDSDGAVPGTYSAAMINWCDTLFCVGAYSIPTLGTTVERFSALTFPPCFSGDWSQGGKFLLDLGCGPTFEAAPAAAGVWRAGAAWRIAGTQRLSMQPVGSYLRLGNFQADLGPQALAFRYESRELQRLRCEKFLFTTFPSGVAVNNAVRGGGAAGLSGAIGFFGAPSAAAGVLAQAHFATEMTLTPSIYTFSPGVAGSHNWYRANGELDGAAPNIVQSSTRLLSLSNPAGQNDPNGSSYYIHAVACCQRGGNGWLGVTI